jgi:hypothetical protein
VHLSVALLILAVVLKAYPWVASPGWWLALGMGLANLWWIVGRAVEPVEVRVCRRLGIQEDRYTRVTGAWSLALFVIGAGLVTGVVTARVLGTVLEVSPAFPTAAGGWWAVLAAHLLAVTCLFLNRSWLPVDHRRMLLHAAVLLFVWWLGTPVSPVATLVSWAAPGYYPVTTALFSLLTVILGRRVTGSGSKHVPFETRAWSAEERSRLTAFTEIAGVCLMLAALAFTKGEVTPATVVTLVLATMTAACLTAAVCRVQFAYAGGALFVATCLFAILLLSTSLTGAAGAEYWVAAAFGLVAGASLLLAAAGRLRAPAKGAQAAARRIQS